MNITISLFGLLIVSSLFVFSSFTDVFGHGLIDQDNSGPVVGAAHSLTQQPLGQEFTPTQDSLIAVDIIIASKSLTAGQTDTVTVTIWEGFIGNNSPLAIGSETVMSDGNTLPGQKIHFELSSPANLIPGHTYVIQVEGQKDILIVPRSASSYAFGMAVINGFSQPLIDFGFATYYEDDFEFLFISDDATGGACEMRGIGVWDDTLKICKLTSDVDSTLVIDSDNITLNCDGHLLTGPGYSYGVSLNEKENVTIKNCNITNFSGGIILTNSNSNTISGNNAFTNMANGIILASSEGNTLNDNMSFENGQDGIRIDSSNNNILNNNQFDENSAIGILMLSSNSNTLNDNSADSNNPVGIVLINSHENTLTGNLANENPSVGIDLNSSTDNSLNNNLVNDNGSGGILLESGSHQNILSKNTANRNGVGDGIVVADSNGNSLLGNTVTGNGDEGIFIFFSDGNIISGNIASKNNHHGMHFAESHNNILEQNITEENAESGILLGESGNNVLNDNISIKNGKWGFLLFNFANENTLYHNLARNNGLLGYQDDSLGVGTGGTDNLYLDNKCVANGSGPNDGSQPGNLCRSQG